MTLLETLERKSRLWNVQDACETLLSDDRVTDIGAYAERMFHDATEHQIRRIISMLGRYRDVDADMIGAGAEQLLAEHGDIDPIEPIAPEVLVNIAYSHLPLLLREVRALLAA